MTSDIVDITKNTQDQILGALGAVQDTIIDNLAKVANTTTKYVPASLRPGGDLPLVGNPADVVDLGFDFATKLLESQKAFADKLLAIAVPAPPAAPKRTAAAK